MKKPDLLHLVLLLALCWFLPSASANVPQPDDSYRISTRDLVEMTVYRQDDLTLEQRVDSRGRIQVPLIGSIEIVGLTIREAESLLERELIEQRMLAKPQVSLRIAEYAPKQVSVLGEVSNPGMVEFSIETYRMDLREVIARAGGFTPVARRNNIQIFRKRPDGTEQSIRVDFGDLLSRSPADLPLYVYDKDVIFVPDRIF